MNKKSIYRSKTFWIAVAQATLAAVGVLSGAFPEWASSLLIAKSLLDIAIRTATTASIT